MAGDPLQQEHLVVRSFDNCPVEHLGVVLETGEIAFLGGHDEVIYDSDHRECEATGCAMRPRA